MQILLVLLLLLTFLPAMGYAQPNCIAPALSDQTVKDIVATQRAKRADLPAPFDEYRWVVRRQGCHYDYIEYGIPQAFHYEQRFSVNQHGVIVDADTGGETMTLTCPDEVLTEHDLAGIVAQEREHRKELPPVFPRYRTRVERLRCLYIFFEYALPETPGNHHVFTIDPFGELMDFLHSQPY